LVAIGRIRVFHDVEEDEVLIHGIVDKAHVAAWLAKRGEPR